MRLDKPLADREPQAVVRRHPLLPAADPLRNVRQLQRHPPPYVGNRNRDLPVLACGGDPDGEQHSGACRAALAKRLLSTCTTRRRSASTRGSPVGRSTRTCVLGFAAPGSSSPPARALGRRNPRVRTPDPAAGERPVDGRYVHAGRRCKEPGAAAPLTRGNLHQGIHPPPTLPCSLQALHRAPCTKTSASNCETGVCSTKRTCTLRHHVVAFQRVGRQCLGRSGSVRILVFCVFRVRQQFHMAGRYVREDRVAHDLPQGGGGKRIEFDAWPAVRP